MYKSCAKMFALEMDMPLGIIFMAKGLSVLAYQHPCLKWLLMNFYQWMTLIMNSVFC